MLTKDIFFGMNILTLVGFVVMGLTLTINRTGQGRKARSIGLMAGDRSGLPWAVCKGVVGIGDRLVSIRPDWYRLAGGDFAGFLPLSVAPLPRFPATQAP